MLSKKLFLASLAVAALACGGGDSGSTGAQPGPTPGADDESGDEDGRGADASASDELDDAGVDDGSDGPVQSMPDGGSPFVPDPMSLDDAGVLQGTGSCCSEHETPGCDNADLMVCVCELDPTCCSGSWGKQCAYIVEQKYCQPNVRDCVCGTEEGQWGQASCCETEWSTHCDSVAKLKCDAVPGCF